MPVDNWTLDTPSFYLGCLATGGLAVLFLIADIAWTAFSHRLSKRRARAASYGRHSAKARKPAPKEAPPCDAPVNPPTVTMPALRPSLEATKRPISSSLALRRQATGSSIVQRKNTGEK